MKIGFTERGDAGLDLSWFDKVKTENCDGLIAITKNLTDGCAQRLLSLHQSGFPVILHAGITGLSDVTPRVERCTPPVDESLTRLQNLIDQGFPKDHIVLRLDPVILEEPYTMAPVTVLERAAQRGLLPKLRVRLSFMDNYAHVQRRFEQNIGHALYQGRWQGDIYQAIHLAQAIRPYVNNSLIDKPETCAEGRFLARMPGQFANMFEPCGCISVKDLEIMGLNKNLAPEDINAQGRTDCMCLACKHELLTRRHPCGNACLYCYWKD